MKGHQRQLTDDDRRRVEEVFETHRRFVEVVARQNANSPDDVPDIVQAVAMQVCRGLNGFRGEAEISTWLFRVTVNAARDCYKSERRHQRAIEAVGAVTFEGTDVLDPDDTVIGGQRLATLKAAVGRLRANHRATIHDRLRNELGLGAGGPAVKDGTRKSRLFRARRQLRQLLNEGEGEP